MDFRNPLRIRLARSVLGYANPAGTLRLSFVGANPDDSPRGDDRHDTRHAEFSRLLDRPVPARALRYAGEKSERARRTRRSADRGERGEAKVLPAALYRKAARLSRAIEKLDLLAVLRAQDLQVVRRLLGKHGRIRGQLFGRNEETVHYSFLRTERIERSRASTDSHRRNCTRARFRFCSGCDVLK